MLHRVRMQLIEPSTSSPTCALVTGSHSQYVVWVQVGAGGRAGGVVTMSSMANRKSSSTETTIKVDLASKPFVARLVQ
jgi:uncharacterized membrane protein